MRARGAKRDFCHLDGSCNEVNFHFSSANGSAQLDDVLGYVATNDDELRLLLLERRNFPSQMENSQLYEVCPEGNRVKLAPFLLRQYSAVRHRVTNLLVPTRREVKTPPPSKFRPNRTLFTSSPQDFPRPSQSCFPLSKQMRPAFAAAAAAEASQHGAVAKFRSGEI